MPYYCRSVVSQALNDGRGRSLSGARILVLGVAYKADIDDMRESPALKMIELLRTRARTSRYHDPHVPELEERAGLELGRRSIPPALRRGRDRHRPLDDRLRALRRRAPARRRPAERDRPRRRDEREGLETVSRARVGLAGLGYWGPNLARNVDDLAELAWLCDLAEDLRARYAGRYPDARVDDGFDEVLADDALEPSSSQRPVPTHYELARHALEAGKHVFVEKPPAMLAVEMEELVRLARERDLVLMPGHLLLYHPGVAEAQGARRLGRARRGALRLRQPPEPRQSSARTRTRSGRSGSTTSP